MLIAEMDYQNPFFGLYIPAHKCISEYQQPFVKLISTLPLRVCSHQIYYTMWQVHAFVFREGIVSKDHHIIDECLPICQDSQSQSRHEVY